MVPKVNTKAPDFTLKNTDGTGISLNDFSKRPKVLFFFPLAFSDVCTDELCSIRDNMKLYNAFDAKVIGISIDSFFALKAFKRSENINFTLLSDFNKEVSARYGVLYDDYFGMKGVAKRSTFVIDREGLIQYKEVLEDSSDLPDFKSIQKSLSSDNK
ncbi:redoxin domain-containing protein [Aliifodinibius salicampi]|uniref:Redoxin domain-containing protein n=1 Tax=Fodinibius salicampi TaxID=1920655 RepID=A0ABT3PVS3_9BACT|nr:redoxin domain-containing protein [Fodinibius salicampi]MCW9711901.1 redoxin domain-containing protein [Fodinibius salicampi]